jgi:perosamine synthetase
MSRKIPVFEPALGEAEIAAVTGALRRGEISGSFGRDITAFEEAFAAYCDCKYGVATTSGTTALILAVAALDLPESSEVLMSASTNIATGLGAYHNRLVPLGVDSERETWNLDLDLIEELIGPRTKAIIPVHIFGHPVDMDRLVAIADKHGLEVIEDCAEAHGAEVRGRKAGSFGHMSCFSFYANKIITTGEGGMVTTNDAELAERLRLICNLGFTQPRFWHQVAGHNFRMTAYQAAMGVVQTAKIGTVVEAKRTMAQRYNWMLGQVPGLRLPREMPWAKHVYWMYSIVVEPEFGVTRDALAAGLAKRGIETRTFFHPINSQPCFANIGMRSIPTPVADELWRTGLYLPSSHTMSEADIEHVAAAVIEIGGEAKT